MHCKQHPESLAVAICAGCGGAICSACSTTLVAGKHCCSNDCANTIKTEQQALSEILNKTRFGYNIIPPLLYSMSLVFFSLAVSSIFVGRFSRADFMAIIAGVVFIFMGIYVKRNVPPAA